MTSIQPSFGIQVEPGPDTTTIAVSGELDSATCEQLVAAVERELSGTQPQKLVLDLRGLTFIDSAGTQTLIWLERQTGERGVPVEVVPAPDEVTDLLRTAGVAERMNLVISPSPSTRTEEFLERIDLELEREATSPARARSELRQLLGSTLGENELAMLVLLTSEVMTNGVIHPRPSPDRRLGLRVTTYARRVRVEVDDPGDGFDPTAPLQPTDRGGRGLMLVDSASMCWGAGPALTQRGERFTVWFEVSLDQSEARAVGE